MKNNLKTFIFRLSMFAKSPPCARAKKEVGPAVMEKCDFLEFSRPTPLAPFSAREPPGAFLLVSRRVRRT